MLDLSLRSAIACVHTLEGRISFGGSQKNAKFDFTQFLKLAQSFSSTLERSVEVMRMPDASVWLACLSSYFIEIYPPSASLSKITLCTKASSS